MLKMAGLGHTMEYTNDAQPSDDDDGERLVIDTSGDDEEDSMSPSNNSETTYGGRSPFKFTPELSSDKVKVLAEAMPELEKHIAKDPELDKIFANSGRCTNIEEYIRKGMGNPAYLKKISEMELSPDLEKALDKTGLYGSISGIPVDFSYLPGYSASSLANLQSMEYNFVTNRHSALSPRDTTISIPSTSGYQGREGCEILPVTLVRSKSSSSRKSKRKTNAPAVKLTRLRKPKLGTRLEGATFPPLFDEVARVRPRLDEVVRKLESSAQDEKRLQELRSMPEGEFAQFRMFRETHFQGYQLKNVPLNAPSPKSDSTNRAMLTNVSELMSNRTEISITPKPTGRMNGWVPEPSLGRHDWLPDPSHVIPKPTDERGRNDFKPSCIRNPPAMLPIEEYKKQNPLSQAMRLLKRLGTDIEIESVPTQSRSSMDCGSSVMAEFDYDGVATLPVECVIEETPNSLSCLDFERLIPKKSTARASTIPPLLPLSSVGRMYPTHQLKPKLKPEQSIREALEHTLAQNLVRTVQNNNLPIAPPLSQPSTSQDKTVTRKREVDRTKIQNKPQPKNVKKQDHNASSSSIESVVSKLKNQKPIEKKTASESAVAIAAETTAIPVEATSVVQEPSESRKDFETVMNNVQLTENKLGEPTDEGDTSESSEASSNPAFLVNEKTTVEKRVETDLKELPASSGNIVSPPSSLFIFDCDRAVITTSIPNQRKLYACSICSAVYVKMYSVKKHYFRNHINPCMVTEEDARKCGLETSAKHSAAYEGFYRCNECKEVFVEMLDLKKHLLVHPVAANESFKRRTKSKTLYRCGNCDMSFAKKRIYYLHSSDCQKVGASAPEPQDVIVSKPTVAPVRESKELPHSQENGEEVDEEKKDALGISQMCLFCDLTFTSTAARKSHVMEQHPPQRKYHSCSYCKGKKFVDLKDLLKHICGAHSKRYFGCAMCKIRFKTKGDLTAHNAESHPTQTAASLRTAATNEKAKPASLVTKPGKVHKCAKCSTIFPTDKELKRHRKKGHNVGKPANTVKTTADPYQQKYRTSSSTNADYETEFYKNITKNVRLNLDHYLDGKLTDTGVIIDQKTTTRRSALQLKTRSSTAAPEERLNENALTFQKMYGSENLNGEFIKNVSRLHLTTQLAVLQKANILEKEPNIEPTTSTTYSTTPKDFALTQNQTVESPVTHEETEDDKSPFSGEWTRPKRYICSTCYVRFSNLRDMEDHGWVKHPNVYITYYEFPADQVPGLDWAMERTLSPVGALNTTVENNSSNTSSPSKCTKCQKVITPIAEFHKHILECGGDTTWAQTMVSASSSSKKHKKWKPYGCRRRKNIGRVRGLKRNIPATPVKIVAHPKNRQKAGDTETIQKMIANLPPKRITRRIVQFDDIESKNRNRNNINNAPSESNILTRQRREKLDTKMNTSTESATVQVPSSRKKTPKRRTPKKSNKSSNSKMTTSSSIELVESGDQTSNTSTSISETDIHVKEEIDCSVDNVSKELEINSAPSSDVQMVISSCAPKQEDEVPEMDLEKMEPADSDACIPDSSVILAAMRETMRQTDAVIPSQTFTTNSKKRKREDLKCKQDPAETSESHEEPPSKRPAFLCVICTVCKNPFSDNGGSHTQVCESCHSKPGSTRSASLRPRKQNKRVRELRNPRKAVVQQKSSSESVVEDAGGENSKIPASVKQKKCTGAEKEDSASKNDVTVNTKWRKSVKKVTINDDTTSTISEVPKTDGTVEVPKTDGTSIDPKCCKKIGASKNSRRSKTQSAEKSESGTSAIDCGAATENLNDKIDQDIKPPKTEEDEIDQNGRNEVSSNGSVVLKKVKNSKIAETSKTSNTNVLETKIVGCEVCQSPSIRSVCVECSSLARKHKVCVYCKQENTSKPCQLPVCVTCKDPNSKRVIVDWIQCKVCDSKSHRDVCCKCVAMSHKFQICALCSTPGVYNQNSGRPVCQACDKKWFPDTNGDDGNVDRCSECTTSQAEETASKICNTPGSVAEPCDTNDVCPPNDDKENANIGVTMDAVVTDSIPVIEAPPANTTTVSSVTNPPILSVIPSTSFVATPTPPTASTGVFALPIPATNPTSVSSISTLAATRGVSEDTQTNNSPSKKHSVFLECKGCGGIFATVSMYKLHSTICSAHRISAEEKKPLLGFVNGSTTLVSNDANSTGPSFEILEASRMRSSLSVNEDANTESHSINDTPGFVYDSDSSTSSKRLELNKSMKTKRSLATDESMNETIESVIQTMCYDSNPVPEDSSPSDSAACCSSTRTPSSDATTEISVTNLENFEKVKNDLETMLETSTTENESSTEVLFPNEEQTIPAQSVSKSKRKKTTPKAKKVSRKGPTTRSSLAKSEVEVPSKIDARTAKKGEVESNASSSSSSSDSQPGTKLIGGENDTIATRLRRKPSDIQPFADEEMAVDDADAGTAAMRLRRKPPVEKTNRTLRSRRKLPIETADKGDETRKAEDLVEEAPNTTKTRKSRDSKRKIDSVEQTVEDEKKQPSAEEEVQEDSIPNKKLKIDDGLGFAAVKANKPTRKGVKRDLSESSLSPSKNELTESDRKRRKLSSCESDQTPNSSALECNNVSPFEDLLKNLDGPIDAVAGTSNFEYGSNITVDGESNAVVDQGPSSTQDQCNFLCLPSTSTGVATYEEPFASTSGLFNDSMYLSVDNEASEAPSFERNHHDQAEASTWRPFLEVTSLGSILDSVNELLSRPEVVSSCVSDTITTQSVKDAPSDDLALQSDANDSVKAKDDHFQQEDESPTLMDLDHQTAHHSEKEETPVSLDGGEPCVEPSPKNSVKTEMELCKMCNSEFADMKEHLSVVHNISVATHLASKKSRTSTRTNQNNLKGQKCSHCQKVLVGKREMASHVDEHVTTFATNQGCDAAALRKGIAEKLEVIFYNNAIDNYLKTTQESNNQPSTSSKTASSLNTAKNSRIPQWNSEALKKLKQASNAMMAAKKRNDAASKTTKQTKKKMMTTREQLNSLLSSANDGDHHFPCPMCDETFKETMARNSHLILIHAPRTSTHPTRATTSESSSKTPSKDKTNESSESCAKSDEKVIRSYLQNESVNSCLEAKKEAVHKAIAESTTKSTNELPKLIGRPAADSLPSSSVADLQTIEGPPALEPAPSGEQILNNTDRSPPKLEASTGAPVPSTSGSSLLRQNLAASSSGNVSQKNGKPCRKKMSKKEIDLPPAVVKFKAEQALLELSIGKFKKIHKP